MTFARPLAPFQRDAFLRAVARNLDGVEVTVPCTALRWRHSAR
jgi:hypothetical protein